MTTYRVVMEIPEPPFRAARLGADIGDFHWNVMQDPEGNEFCIAGD
jgi:hypothetical protein